MAVSTDGSARPHPVLLRLKHGWQWYMNVRTDDPARETMNRGLLIIIAAICGLAFASLATAHNLEEAIISAAAGVLIAGCAIPTRRGGVMGGYLVVAVAVVGLVLSSAPEIYLHNTTGLSGIFLLPVAIATLTIRPRAGIIAAVCIIAALMVRALPAAPLPWLLTDFVPAELINLLSLTIPLMVVAALFARALRERAAANAALQQLNATLEQQVQARTADLASANEELAAAKERIERASAVRAKDTTELVHDARNFLAAIDAAIENLLLDVELGELSAAALEATRVSVKGVLGGLRELLAATHEAALLEAGTLVLRPAPTNLGALARTVENQMRARFAQQRCKLTVDVADCLPVVMVDPIRMQRVLQNLLGNALIYTSDYRKQSGGEVRLVVEMQGAQVVCCSTDNGPGIAPENLARLGQRFVRLAQGAEAPEGSGIGLNFVAGFMRLSDGTFQITSPGLGLGATAMVGLPIAAEPSASGIAQSQQSCHQTQPVKKSQET